MSRTTRSWRAAPVPPLSLALLLVVVVCCAAALVSATSVLSESEAATKHALLVAIPLPGHLNPLISQGLELRRRGWSVTLASPARMQQHIRSAIDAAHRATVNITSSRAARGRPLSLLELQYMNLGECAAVGELHAALRRSADHDNYMESAREMFEWSVSLHGCMYASLVEQIPRLDKRPDVIVSDFATYAGFDVADALGIPFVVNNADLLNMLSAEDVPPYDFVPGTMTATSLSAFNSSSGWYGLAARVIYPPARMLLQWIAEATAGAALGEQQRAVGLTPTGIFSRFRRRVILVNNVFGLEYARPLPPNVVLVGPMLDHPWTLDRQRARAEYRAQLSQEDAEWLAATNADGTPAPPVVWVSMGTIAPLNERQVQELYGALSAGAREGRFRVLWKLPPSDEPYIPAPEARPPTSSFRVVRWVSSQLGVLAHDATGVFLSHCGINSVHESVYLGTKLLCIPILADQADMAARVQDAGCGSHLSKSGFTSTSVGAALAELLSPSTAARFRSSLARARDAMLLSGGVDRAVDYIEYVASHGSDALTPVHASHPYVARHNLDVFAIHVALLYLAYLALRWICCECRPGRECTESRRKTREADKHKDE